MRKLIVLVAFLSFALGPIAVSAQDSAPSSERAALLLTSQFPDFQDEDSLRGLTESVQNSLLYFRQLPLSATVYFGADAYSVRDLIQSADSIVQFLSKPHTAEDFNRLIRSDFNVYRSQGAGDLGEVTFSSYYEVSFQASLKPEGEYRYPIYARPPDLLDAVLSDFSAGRKGERIAGRADGRNLVPYYSREEIDSKGVLRGKNLEVAWAKSPLDILFLQIQGSGWISTPDNQLFHIRYAGDNGRPFKSVGLYLIESGAIPKPEFTKARMVEYLNGLPDNARQNALNQNSRYIFFEVTSPTTATRGSLMVPLTPERSVASDPKFYPPGALAWIHTQRPVIDSQGRKQGVQSLSRFVLNQDEGGAIKGPGRIDFFMGRGLKAEKTAESLWYPGELYFFVLRPRPR